MLAGADMNAASVWEATVDILAKKHGTDVAVLSQIGLLYHLDDPA